MAVQLQVSNDIEQPTNEAVAAAWNSLFDKCTPEPRLYVGLLAGLMEIRNERIFRAMAENTIATKKQQPIKELHERLQSDLWAVARSMNADELPNTPVPTAYQAVRTLARSYSWGVIYSLTIYLYYVCERLRLCTDSHDYLLEAGYCV